MKRLFALAFGLATALVGHADPLVVVVESPAFTLDTRLADAGGAASALVVQAESPGFLLDLRLRDPGGSLSTLVVQAASPAFTLDLRLVGADAAQGAYVVQAVSPTFTLDTRLATGANSVFAAVVESGAFTLDTRLSAGTSATGLVVAVESPAFTLDTRLTTGSGSLVALVVSAQSPAFTLDTRVSPSNPILDALVVQATSPAFTLDTRLTPPDPIYATLVVSAQSPAFTLDTKSGWVNTTFTTLAPYAGSGQGGKARFSPDGQQLAKADGARVVLWNLQDTRSPVLFSGAPAAVTTLEFSPLGDQLLTGGRDGSVLWWDTASRAPVGQLPPGDGGPAYAAWSADGARLLVGSGTNLQLYSYPATNPLQAFAGLSNQISAVALSPDGTRALAGTADRAVTVWDTSNAQPLWRLSGHVGLITAAAFYPDGSNAMTASLDGTIRVWDCSRGLETFHITQNTPVADAVLSADGRGLLSCAQGNPLVGRNGLEGRAYLWDAQSGALERVFSDAGDTAQMTGVAISPDQTMVCTTHSDGTVHLWDSGEPPVPVHPVMLLPLGTNTPVTLRSHGLYYFAVDNLAGRSMVVTLEAAGGSAAAKALKSDGEETQTTGLSPDAEFANVGRVAPANPRPKTLRTFPFSTDLTAFRMTATEGRLPSEYDYEAFAQATVTNLHCEMPLAGTTSGKSYVLVFAPYLSAGSITARIRADYADFHLSNVTPARGGNSGNVTAKVQGTGITPDTTVRLVNGGASIPGQIAMWGDSTKAWFTFPLSNSPAGSYSLELSRAGFASVTLSNAFAVVTGVGPLLQTRLDTPSAVRPGRDYSMTVYYANMGDVDIAAPLLTVSAQNLSPWIYPLSGISPNAVKLGKLSLLGIPAEGPAGVLPPGTENEVPLYFQAPNDRSVASMAFNLEVTPADSTPIDWTSRKDSLGPPTLDPAVWDVVFANLTADLTNNAAYVLMFDDNAQYLSQLGQRVMDVDTLWNFALRQAYGFSPVATLDSAVDASVPAPGVTLDFARQFSSNLRARNSTGPFGYGWYTPWQATLLMLNGGAVVQLVGEAGSARAFTRDSGSGTFLSDSGDASTLIAIAGGLFELHDSGGIVTRFRADGRIDFVQDPNTNQVTARYDGASRLESLSHTSGGSISLTYNGAGLVQTVSDSGGHSRAFTYDASNSYLESVTTDDGKVTTYTYDTAGPGAQRHALTSVTRDGTARHFTFDAHGRLATTYLASGEQLISYGYDSAGGVSVADAAGTTRLYYDPRALLVEVVDPVGNTRTADYDDNFHVTRIVAPTGESSSYTWCGCGSLTSLTDELGRTINLDYGNPFKRLTSFVDAKNNITAYSYDATGNILSTTYPDSSRERFENYSPAGLAQTYINRRNQATTYTYKPSGQLERQTFADGSFTFFDYDVRGNLTNITEHTVFGTNKLTQYTYDLARDGDRVRQVTYPNGRWVALAYDAFGRRQRISDSTGQTNSYEYDVAGRLWTLRDATNGLVVEYLYNPAGRLQRVNKGNGTFTTYGYDAAGHVVHLTNSAPNGEVNSRFDYTYDSRGRRRTMSTLDGNWAYDYDGSGQLTHAVFVSSTPAITNQEFTYNYDAAGNRIFTVVNGSTTNYVANALNEYSSVGGTSYQYDADGNLAFDGVRNYTYDSQNRLVGVSGPEGITAYEYDFLGHRTATVFNGERTEYLLDPVGLYGFTAEIGANGSVTARYVWGLGLIAMIRGSGGSLFYDFDALGSTTSLTDSSGAPVNRYAYSPYGERLMATQSVENPFQFVGKFGVVRETLGLDLMRARFYSPMLGAFTSLDPIRLAGGDANLHRYVKNSPVATINPLRLDSVGHVVLKPQQPPLGDCSRCNADLFMHSFCLFLKDVLWFDLPPEPPLPDGIVPLYPQWDEGLPLTGGGPPPA